MALLSPIKLCGLVGCIWVKCHFNSQGHIMAVIHTFPGFLTPVLTQLSFQSHRLLFSHASAEVRSKICLKESLPLLGIKLRTTR